MKMYIEMFKNIDLRPCELVAIREIAVEYRRQLLLKYHVSDDSVISVLDAGREKFTFQEINLKAELRYKDIIIDLEKREVIRGNRRIVLTYCMD